MKFIPSLTFEGNADEALQFDANAPGGGCVNILGAIKKQGEIALLTAKNKTLF